MSPVSKLLHAFSAALFVAFLIPTHILFGSSFGPATVLAAPGVSVQSTTELDARGIYFVSYDGLVNVNSFQLSGILTYNNYQYAAWYTSTRYVILARRSVTSGGWSTLQLNHQLSTDDSHNVVVLGVSPSDGRLHVAMDCHSTGMSYAVSEAGLVNGGDWNAGRFPGGVKGSLGILNLGGTVTYPQFVLTPDTNVLQFVYRSGVSGNGATQLAEYRGGTNGDQWVNVGSWASASGTYQSTNGATSTARNLYIHGFTYDRNARVHVTGTWREQNGAVMCNGGGLTNHDTVYFYSDDKGRNWKNSAGAQIATSGSNPVNVNTANIIADPINADHGLMNQESQDVDSAGQIHAIISYMPGRFGQCVTNYQKDRTANGRAFHVYRPTSGVFTKTEIPVPLNAVGRSQIVIDPSNDDAYVVMPYVRVVTASKASGYTDWTMVYDGVGQGLNAFGEITLDRARVKKDRVISVLYQLKSSGTTPSPVRVIDFRMGG